MEPVEDEEFDRPEWRRLENAEFELLDYLESEFSTSDHVHCELCGTKITYLDCDGCNYRGYAKAFEIYDLPTRYGAVLRWVCESCFHTYSESMKFRVSNWLTDALKQRGLRWNRDKA